MLACPRLLNTGFRPWRCPITDSHRQNHNRWEKPQAGGLPKNLRHFLRVTEEGDIIAVPQHSVCTHSCIMVALLDYLINQLPQFRRHAMTPKNLPGLHLTRLERAWHLYILTSGSSDTAIQMVTLRISELGKRHSHTQLRSRLYRKHRTRCLSLRDPIY